ncbi:MAG: hypothetical protein KAH93_05550 [Candidatus Aenigmarchaeota archaeon]|nr:hypothetical protein [Candidatus Aenigmarchaeota archaeon]
MRRWFSQLSPDAQAKIFLGVTAMQILVNVFIFVGLGVVVFRVFMV